MRAQECKHQGERATQRSGQGTTQHVLEDLGDGVWAIPLADGLSFTNSHLRCRKQIQISNMHPPRPLRPLPTHFSMRCGNSKHLTGRSQIGHPPSRGMLERDLERSYEKGNVWRFQSLSCTLGPSRRGTLLKTAHSASAWVTQLHPPRPQQPLDRPDTASTWSQPTYLVDGIIAVLPVKESIEDTEVAVRLPLPLCPPPIY